MTLRTALVPAAICCCSTLWIASSAGQDAGQKLILLNVSNGQLPPDTGLDDKTKPEIVENIKSLGAKALKVAFAPGDSFGTRGGGNANWKRFTLFRFDAVNPAQAPVALELTVVHRRSTSYQTRA